MTKPKSIVAAILLHSGFAVYTAGLRLRYGRHSADEMVDTINSFWERTPSPFGKHTSEDS